jgi:hypothetical protein
MTFLGVFLWVLLELGVGTALFALVQRTGEIRKSFFSFMAFIAAVCFLLISLLGMKERFFASICFPAAVFSALSAYHFSSERYSWGKGMLSLGIVVGLFQAIVGAMEVPLRTGSMGFTILSFVFGTFLFGWSNGSMILGHWYLIMRGLSFDHFRRANFQLLVALGLRWVGFVWGYVVFGGHGTGMEPDVLLLTMRPLWGLVLPSIFGFMAWRCSLIGSNQAGTGLLYIAEVAVLIGEVLSGFTGF